MTPKFGQRSPERSPRFIDEREDRGEKRFFRFKKLAPEVGIEPTTR